MIKTLKRSVESTLITDSQYDPEWTYIEVLNDPLSYRFNIHSPVIGTEKFTVDWGDGTIDHSSSHAYQERQEGPNKRIIKIKGLHNACYYYADPSIGSRVRSSIFDVKHTKGLLSVEKLPDNFNKRQHKSLNHLCMGLTNLTNVEPGVFKYCKDAVTCKEIFKDCVTLTELPRSLFNGFTSVISFNGTFNNTGLTTIPEDLFKDCIQVKNFTNTFSYCGSLESIPEQLFSNCINVTAFNNTFKNCELLTSIPSNLFKNNTKVVSFVFAFKNTGCSSIPPDLFKNNINAEYLNSVFNIRLLRKSNPEILFANCPGKDTYDMRLDNDTLMIVNNL